MTSPLEPSASAAELAQELRAMDHEAKALVTCLDSMTHRLREMNYGILDLRMDMSVLSRKEASAAEIREFVADVRTTLAEVKQQLGEALTSPERAAALAESIDRAADRRWRPRRAGEGREALPERPPRRHRAAVRPQAAAHPALGDDGAALDLDGRDARGLGVDDLGLGVVSLVWDLLIALWHARGLIAAVDFALWGFA
jgi:hypothetical protein